MPHNLNCFPTLLTVLDKTGRHQHTSQLSVCLRQICAGTQPPTLDMPRFLSRFELYLDSLLEPVQNMELSEELKAACEALLVPTNSEGSHHHSEQVPSSEPSEPVSSNEPSDEHQKPPVVTRAKRARKVKEPSEAGSHRPAKRAREYTVQLIICEALDEAGKSVIYVSLFILRVLFNFILMFSCSPFMHRSSG